MLQLVTFNDFGEGTMFEPTVETGFDYLEQVQIYTGVSYGLAEFTLIQKLYTLRKTFVDDPDTQDLLDQASAHLSNLEVNEAFLLLESILPSLIFEQELASETPGPGIHISPNPVADGIVYFRTDFREEIKRVIISDLSGKIVYKAGPWESRDLYCIDDLKLPAGIYFLSVHGIQGISTAKFSVAKD